MILTYQPLTTVKSVSFQNMISSLHKKALVISYGKIHSMMSLTFYDTMYSIQRIVKGKDVALMTDAWMSVTNDGYVHCISLNPARGPSIASL
jgi:hypothetical protein